MQRLDSGFRIIAPDLYDVGESPHWPSDSVIRLRDEAASSSRLLALASDDPVALVGHSYGAAVALIAALANPGRVRALALYEPTLFSLIDAQAAPPNEADGIREAVADAERALDAGDPNAAAERFIDYWMGAGAWTRFPEPRKAPIVASIRHVRQWRDALFNEPTPLGAFRLLDVPVLYMVGKRSTASALAVARLLANALPKVELVEFESLDHMGPVTGPDAVNEVIAHPWSAVQRPGWACASPPTTFGDGPHHISASAITHYRWVAPPMPRREQSLAGAR